MPERCKHRGAIPTGGFVEEMSLGCFGPDLRRRRRGAVADRLLCRRPPGNLYTRDESELGEQAGF
jgi:hypothetical protein